jgi:uncharacterized protein DUF4349
MMREAVNPERLAALLDGREAPQSAEERALVALAVDVRELEGPAPESLRTRLDALVAGASGEAAQARRPGWLASLWAGGGRRRTMVGAPIGALAAAALAAALLIPGGGNPPSGPAEGFKAQTPATGGASSSAPAAPEAMRAQAGDAATPLPRQAAPPANTFAAPGAAVTAAPPVAAGARPQDVRTWTRVQVPDVEALSQASTRAMDAVHDLGGFTASSRYSVPDAGQGENRLVFRVPPARVEAALRAFSSLGVVIGQQARTVDLGARIDSGAQALRRQLQRVRQLRTAVAGDPGNPELAARLARAEAAYRAAADRQNAVLDRTRMATVDLTLTTAGPPEDEGQFIGAINRAGGRLAGAAAWVAQAIILLGPPLLIMGAALAAWHARRRRARRRLLEAS